jgi:hypothetical protein
MKPDEISTFLEDVYITKISQNTINKLKNAWTELDEYDFVEDATKLQTGYFIRLIKLDMETMLPSGIITKIIYRTNNTVKYVYIKINKRVFRIIPTKYYMFQLRPQKNGFASRELRRAIEKYMEIENRSVLKP